MGCLPCQLSSPARTRTTSLPGPRQMILTDTGSGLLASSSALERTRGRVLWTTSGTNSGLPTSWRTGEDSWTLDMKERVEGYALAR